MLRRIFRSLHIGQEIPNIEIMTSTPHWYKGYEAQLQMYSSKLFRKRKIILVGFTGAFVPLCQEKHLPGFINLYDQFKKKGYEVVAMSVSDPFVTCEFAKELGGKIIFIADGSGELTQLLDAGMDISEYALGYRSRRFTAIVDNGVIQTLFDEGGYEFTDTSSAETILRKLDDEK